MPTGCYSEREKLLGQRWKALSETERAEWGVHTTTTSSAAKNSSWHKFCREQRPLLPPGLKYADELRLLSEQWKALSEAESAKWEALSKAAMVPATTRPDTSASPAPLELAALYLAPASATAPAATAAPLLATPVSFASMPEMVLTGAVELMTAEEALEVMLNY